MAEIPGLKARHAIIKDACRTSRGNEGAIDEALARLKEEYLSCVDGWEIGKGAQFHLVLTVEKPPRS